MEKLDNSQLDFMMAVGVSQQNNTYYGKIHANCAATMDNKGGVSCSNLVITDINFPTLKQPTGDLQLIQQSLSQQSFVLSAEQLKSSLKLSQINQLKDENPQYEMIPPKIFITMRPTVLVLIDGEPQLRNIPNSDLMRVINTAFVIILDAKTGFYYLQAGSRWMQAEKIEGPWQLSINIPDSIKNIEVANPTSTEQSSTEIPDIIVSFESAELIQIDGEPQFAAIDNTGLMYVTNTDDDVFYQVKQQDYYILLSGRWYKSNELNSSVNWSYVSPDKLPQSFADISTDSPVGDVLASVPNTPQAEEAVIRNDIPKTAKIKRSEAKVNVTYDGEPQFKPIPNTRMQYAVNSENDVIGLDNRYYAVYEGVWFVSDSPLGPWVVLVDVPDEIYTIPPSVPVYPATYVYVYDYDPEYVYVGYTGGYLGSYILNSLLIYGTGYYYRPWIGRHYYGAPITYGFDFCYNNSYAYWRVCAPYISPWWYGAGLRLGVNRYEPIGWRTGWFGPSRGSLFVNRINFNQFNFYNSNINIYNSHNLYKRWGRHGYVNDWNYDRLNRFTRNNDFNRWKAGDHRQFEWYKARNQFRQNQWGGKGSSHFGTRSPEMKKEWLQRGKFEGYGRGSEKSLFDKSQLNRFGKEGMDVKRLGNSRSTTTKPFDKSQFRQYGRDSITPNAQKTGQRSKIYRYGQESKAPTINKINQKQIPRYGQSGNQKTSVKPYKKRSYNSQTYQTRQPQSYGRPSVQKSSMRQAPRYRQESARRVMPIQQNRMQHRYNERRMQNHYEPRRQHIEYQRQQSFQRSSPRPQHFEQRNFRSGGSVHRAPSGGGHRFGRD